MKTLVEAPASHRKFNPWAIPMWCFRHPVISTVVSNVTLGVSLLLLGATLNNAGLAGAGIVLLIILGAMLFVISVWAILEFFFDGGYDSLKDKVIQRYESHGRIED